VKRDQVGVLDREAAPQTAPSNSWGKLSILSMRVCPAGKAPMFHATGDMPAAAIAEATLAASPAASEELPMKIARCAFTGILRR